MDDIPCPSCGGCGSVSVGVPIALFDTELFFRVKIVGEPKGAGSKNAVCRFRNGNPVMHSRMRSNGTTYQYPQIVQMDSSGEKGKLWRDIVLLTVRAKYLSKPLNQPLFFDAFFFQQRPASHYVADNRSRPLKADVPILPMTTPDSTKLLRSIEDACKGVLWTDDKVNAQVRSTKLYADWSGAIIMAYRIMGVRSEQLAILNS